jgi:hypothetical protein
VIRLRHLAWAPALLALASCQVVAKLETRTTDPLVKACSLPSEGDGRVRIANLVPDAQPVDFCVRPSGGAYARPILRGGGLDCANGYKYEEISAAFAVPVGKIDLKTIPAGLTCAAPALSEIDGVDVGSEATVTIARMGGDGVTEQLRAFPEATAIDARNMKLRFVNAIPGSKPLYLGIAKDARLPTDVDTRLLTTAVPFGATPSSGDKSAVGTIDDAGYLVIAPNTYELGAAEDGAKKALLVAEIPAHAASFTLFAIGNPDDLAFPLRGLLCDETTKGALATPCVETALPTLSVDVFNVGLYGANAPDESGRRPAIQQAIAKRDADLACILEAGRQLDRDAIIAAARSGAFPYATTATTDLGTPFTDPRNQSGATPAPPASPACAGSVSAQQVDDAFTCMADHCSTKPGDASGTIQGTTDCLSSHCAVKLAPLFAGTIDQQRCFDCIVDNVTADRTYEDSKTACTTDARRPLAFGGENPSMILSRYPLANADVFVLPSTNFRRSVLYAEVELQKGATVDFYCAQFSSPLLDADLPYTGDYSGGDPAHGYDGEQLLQANELIAWVKRKSGNRPTIIAGDWHASVAFTQSGAKVIDDLNPQTILSLRDAFQEAIAPSWTPTCTYCPSPMNPYNGGFKVGYAFASTYLFNWPAKATTDEALLFTDAIIPTATGSEMLSPSFGLNVRVIRP